MINRRYFITKASGIISFLSLGKISLASTRDPKRRTTHHNNVDYQDVRLSDVYTKAYDDPYMNTHAIEYSGKITFANTSNVNPYHYFSKVLSMVPLPAPGYKRIKYDVQSMSGYEDVNGKLQFVLHDGVIKYETMDILLKPVMAYHANGMTSYHDTISELITRDDITHICLQPGSTLYETVRDIHLNTYLT